MTLKDLMDFDEGSEEDEKEEKEEATQQSTLHNINYDMYASSKQADMDKEYKYCPSCLTKSFKEEERWYGCPSEKCGTSLFRTGWREWYFTDFLSEVEFDEI